MPARVTFGAFCLELQSGALTRDGRDVPLQSQPARVLVHLVEHAGAVVTREELRHAIWGNAWVNHNEGLNYCIRQIRVALGDEARSPVYLQTLPQRGYRFIADVHPAAVVAPATGRAMPPRWAAAACVLGAGVVIGLSAARVVVIEMIPAPVNRTIAQHLDPIDFARGAWTHHLKPLLTASAPTPDSSPASAAPAPAPPGSRSPR